jgi:hypothetical protein
VALFRLLHFHFHSYFDFPLFTSLSLVKSHTIELHWTCVSFDLIVQLPLSCLSLPPLFCCPSKTQTYIVMNGMQVHWGIYVKLVFSVWLLFYSLVLLLSHLLSWTYVSGCGETVCCLFICETDCKHVIGRMHMSGNLHHDIRRFWLPFCLLRGCTWAATDS